MRCISGERGRRTMVHILPTPRSQQITILTTLSGRPSHFSHKNISQKLFKFDPSHFLHKKKTFHIFTASSWTYRNILIISKTVTISMTRVSVAFGPPWCTSGLKKVVLDAGCHNLRLVLISKFSQNVVLETRMLCFSRHSRQICRKSRFLEQNSCF